MLSLVRTVAVLPVAVVFLFGFFIFAACNWNDISDVALANFSSSDGWELIGTEATDDWVLTERFSFSGSQVTVRPSDMFANITTAALPNVSIGQVLNLRRNTYYRLRIDGRFVPDAGAATTGSIPSIQLRIGRSTGNASSVDTGFVTMNSTPTTWTVITLLFNSGNIQSVDFEIVVGRGTRAGNLIISNFVAERVNRDDILGNDARSLDRKQVDGRDNLITTDWVYGLPLSPIGSYIPLLSDWNINGDITARVVRHQGAAQLRPWLLELSLDPHGSGFVNSRIAVRSGRYYRMTFDYRIMNTLVPQSIDPEGPFGVDRFGLFASLNGRQSDILRRDDRSNFNHYEATRSSPAATPGWRTSEPIFIRARGNTLDITLNLGFPGGGETSGSVDIANIILEEVGVTAVPVNQPFLQDAGANVGVIIAWVIFVIVLTTAVIIGLIIGITIYTSRRRNAKEAEIL